MIRVLQVKPSGDKLEVHEQVVDLKDADARAFVMTPEPGTMRWVDVSQQSSADIDLLAQGFRFHPLALEDCLHFDQRPKVEEYTGQKPYLFLVTHHFAVLPTLPSSLRKSTADEEENSMHMPRLLTVSSREQQCSIAIYETHAFLGHGFLVTVHAHANPAIDSVWQRVRHDPQLFRRGADFVYYMIADLLCDTNFPVLEQIGDILDEMEEAVMEEPERSDLHRIYDLRKTLVSMRRVLSPQRDVMGNLSRHGGSAMVSEKTAPYFRDIYDHLTRIYESIEAGRDLLGNCVDAYMSAVGQRTNEIMKQLTILSAILLPLTFISGLFGMNFEMMPFKSSGAFTAAMVLMFLIIPPGMMWYFRSRGWWGSDAVQKK